MKSLFCTSLAVLAGVASAQTYGNTTPFETQAGNPQDFILGVQVSISSTMTLDSFGMIYGIGTSTQLTANGKFALYTSNGGIPQDLVAETGSISLSGSQTFDNIAFTSHPTVGAGTYWMMSLYDSGANPRYSVLDSGSKVAYWFRPFADGFNATAPSVTTENGQNFNFWVNGHAPVPEPAAFAALGFGVLAFVIRRRGVK